ncbi:MAG: DUF3570 domain-containing protein [Flavobacteriaceae bacterium]
MKKHVILLLIFCGGFVSAQETKGDSDGTYKKRVLESIEVDFLMSYYNQDGDHAAVTGGIGTEKLTDITPTFIVAIPLNADDVLTVDVGISAYSSASSSNLDPFDSSGASQGGDDDDDDRGRSVRASTIKGSPWVESSGASASDVWFGTGVSYSHSSDDRNSIISANVNFASEYDYTSIGFGGGYTRLFNEKNTEIGIKAQVYLDTWNPKYPTELDSYLEVGGNLNNGFFAGIDILDELGNIIDKDGPVVWAPQFGFISDKSRNSYSVSLNFSQILSKNVQVSFFLDVIQQSGWLSNPMQRVYFSDTNNYYIGNTASIPNYTSLTNKDVFRLADDIEQLPDSRLKIPIGMRFNYYINEIVSIRTYYRYYYDDWGINAHTANIEIPVKIGDKFTVYPNYRYYTQTAADYFTPFDTALSTDKYYTSDYDLSAFDSHQYGLGIKYTDLFTKAKLLTFGLKSIDLRYANYTRSDGLDAGIISFGIKFVQ